MKVTVKKKQANAPEQLTIETEYIKLESAMKFASLVATGGEAKSLILEEQVRVNGEVCTMRGKKLRDGDVFSFMGHSFVIVQNGAE